MLRRHASIHQLKSWPEPFADLKRGVKTFEYRVDDREYQVGSYLLLREYEPQSRTETGDRVIVQVTHLLRNAFGVPDGYVCMSVRMLSDAECRQILL